MEIKEDEYGIYESTVTILILVDGFLQSERKELDSIRKGCHNPYFSRWFSAINERRRTISIRMVTILILVDGFLQFHGWMRRNLK